MPIFDFDGNLLTTKADHKRERYDAATGTWIPVNITWTDFCELPAAEQALYRPSTQMYIYWDYTDQGGDDTMLEQVLEALENRTNLGAAVPFLHEHVRRGVPFNILTGREHSVANMRRAVEQFLRLTMSAEDLVLGTKRFVTETASVFGFRTENGWWGEYLASEDRAWKQYMDGCRLIAVLDPWYTARHPCGTDSALCKAEEIRALMGDILPFTHTNKTVVVSFFDDELPNVHAVEKIFVEELVGAYPEVCFRIYDTSDLQTAKRKDYSAVCSELGENDWETQIIPKIL